MRLTLLKCFTSQLLICFGTWSWDSIITNCHCFFKKKKRKKKQRKKKKKLNTTLQVYICSITNPAVFLNSRLCAKLLELLNAKDGINNCSLTLLEFKIKDLGALLSIDWFSGASLSLVAHRSEGGFSAIKTFSHEVHTIALN